ncbi:hypothetical protein GDO81_023149 [Engystomops pustulosus]|uniref:Uncharacterized protein n=1 Tax=Engystomops pustulosus TaxID=76066 RepID=A0AAV6YM03_ENGPU|nr:hypothetical protein GDO81_023149 [Engystomops pustulosus]
MYICHSVTLSLPLTNSYIHAGLVAPPGLDCNKAHTCCIEMQFHPQPQEAVKCTSIKQICAKTLSWNLQDFRTSGKLVTQLWKK